MAKLESEAREQRIRELAELKQRRDNINRTIKALEESLKE